MEIFVQQNAIKMNSKIDLVIHKIMVEHNNSELRGTIMKQLATDLDVTERTIRMYVNGESTPSIENFSKIFVTLRKWKPDLKQEEIIPSLEPEPVNA